MQRLKAVCLHCRTRLTRGGSRIYISKGSDISPGGEVFVQDACMQSHFGVMCIYQGFANPALEGRRPACLRRFPASAHLIHINGLFTDLCRPRWQAGGDPLMWISCVVAAKHLKTCRTAALQGWICPWYIQYISPVIPRSLYVNENK